MTRRGVSKVRAEPTREAEVIQVIRTRSLVGAGTEDDMAREVTQYWSPEGQLLATVDRAEDKLPGPQGLARLCLTFNRGWDISITRNDPLERGVSVHLAPKDDDGRPIQVFAPTVEEALQKAMDKAGEGWCP